MHTNLNLIMSGLESGLPVLIGHFLLALALLIIGAKIYTWITPFDEWKEIAAGNPAAALVFAGTLFALAIPIAATLATSSASIDIALWGIVALALQLATFAAASLLLHDLRHMVETRNVAAAMSLVGMQLAVALINAGTMAG